jgi:endonuclease YncB( thermonuclease family)
MSDPSKFLLQIKASGDKYWHLGMMPHFMIHHRMMHHRMMHHRIMVLFWCWAIIFLLLVSCDQEETTSSTGAEAQLATVVLPTPKLTVPPSPVNTRVLPVEVLTPPATPTITPIPDETLGLVVEVIDGDTIAVVLDGDTAGQAYQVRYIGIAAPENSAADPWGAVAFEVNRRLTNLKVVRLVRDQTDFDSEGYLLRHVYVDGQLVSVVLAEQGLARAAIAPPNTRFEDEILAAVARATADGLGIWGGRVPTATPAPTRPPTITRAAANTPTSSPQGAGATSTGEAEATAEATGEATPTGARTTTPGATVTGTPTSQ